MKKKVSFTVLLLLMALAVSAQVPQKFNYQAVIRNAQHVVIGNQDVGFRMSIIEGSANGSPVYVETHTVTTNPVGVADLLIGEGLVVSGVFTDIIWGDNAYYLKVEADPAGGTSYEHLGTSQLISVPYALYSANISSPTKKFTIQENTGHPVDSALFEVRNAEGQTVFAVYPEGTRIYILDEDAKGLKGGFAVGGYSRTSKGPTQEYMRVTPDSIRMYFDDNTSKGLKGGFAVGGYSRTSKGPAEEYFSLSPDKAWFTMVSDNEEEMGTNALTVSNRSRAGGADLGTYNLFKLSRDNYFIGHRAGSSNTAGMMNCFFGYQSGVENTRGGLNLFMGFEAGKLNTTGNENVFIGVDAGRTNTSGQLNTAIGSEAGEHLTTGGSNVMLGTWAGRATGNGSLNTYIGTNTAYQLSDGLSNTFLGAYTGSEVTTGEHNVFLGIRAGSHVGSDFNTIVGAFAGADVTNGGHNVFVGTGAGQNSTGRENTFVGIGSGLNNRGDNNIFVGTSAGFNCHDGTNNVFIGNASGGENNGSGNIFIGNMAGNVTDGSNMLLIDNEPGDSETNLIYGSFSEDFLRFNNKVGIGMNPTDVALAVNGDAYKTDGNASWEVTSDARVKTGIQTIENGLEKIMRLRPVTFRYSEKWRQANPGVKDKDQYHYVAQEFAEVFPEAVHRGPESIEGESENLLRMNSQPAQVVAIRAIQELAEQNRKQQELIEQLYHKVEALESMVAEK